MLPIIGAILAPIVDAFAAAVGIPEEVRNSVKIGISAATGNVVGVVEGGIGLASNIAGRIANTEYQPTGFPPGYSNPPKDTTKLKETDKHLKNIRDNLSEIEGLSLPFWKDGIIGMADLDLAIAHPKCPPSLRESLLWLKHNPDVFAKCDTAAGIGWKDGLIGISDLHSALYKTSEELKEAEFANKAWRQNAHSNTRKPDSVFSSSKSKCASNSNEIRDILNDKSLSIEEKIKRILFAMMEQTDNAILDVMGELDDALDEQAGVDSQDKKANQAASKKTENIEFKLQEMMERRKRMFDLLTNMSSNFHEMGSAAIQNMGRA